jgi:hypothetical protein
VCIGNLGLRKQEEKIIITWERKILRILGPKEEDEVWKIRMIKN